MHERTAVALAAACALAAIVTAGPPLVAQRSDALDARVASSTALPDVRSGSALVRLGAQLVIVQDDHARVALLDPISGRVTGDPRLGGPQAKLDKPDWEAAFAADDGAIYLLGSGATPKRRRLDRLAADGGRTSLPVDALYALIERALATPPNIEGAVRIGSRVRLFHRGSGDRRSATVDVELAALLGGAPRHEPPRYYDLGRLGDVALHFTDAVVLRGEKILYLAVAEDTADAVSDGALRGAALGVLEGDTARWTPLRDESGAPSKRKFEGIMLDDRGGWLVSDPDDPLVPSELCRLELRGPW